MNDLACFGVFKVFAVRIWPESRVSTRVSGDWQLSEIPWRWRTQIKRAYEL